MVDITKDEFWENKCKEVIKNERKNNKLKELINKNKIMTILVIALTLLITANTVFIYRFFKILTTI
ncbi:MAG: hypothetical protein Q4G09_00990 [Clostridia bacterium]|nr:hypothetical protein [Clostridia bacterium]